MIYVCKKCGKEFKASPCEKRQYCSKKCVDNAREPKPLEDRFWSHVNKTDDCWLWTTAKKKESYGMIGLGGKGAPLERAHRISWQLAYGPIPDGLYVLHTCDNRWCVNPEHLFLGTHLDNVEDMIRKKRNTFGERSNLAKLTEDEVVAIRSQYATGGVLQRELAARYGITREGIGRITRGEHWKHLL